MVSWIVLHRSTAIVIVAVLVLLLVLRAYLHWRAEDRLLSVCAREVVAVLVDMRGDATDGERAPHMVHYLAQALDVLPEDVRVRRRDQVVEVSVRGPIDKHALLEFERRVLEHPDRSPWIRFEIRTATEARAPWTR
jgi:hypothetical protein